MATFDNFTVRTEADTTYDVSKERERISSDELRIATGSPVRCKRHQT